MRLDQLDAYMNWLMVAMPILIFLIGLGLILSIVGTILEHYQRKKEERRRACDVILVEASPPPSRSLPTNDSIRRRASPRSAVRAGARKIPYHHRTYTCTYNPSFDGHCVYACALRAKGTHVCMRSIRVLREQVSSVRYDAYMQGVPLGGIDVPDLLLAEGLSLHAYMEQTRHGKWASAAEAHAAYRVLNLNMDVWANKWIHMREGSIS